MKALRAFGAFVLGFYGFGIAWALFGAALFLLFGIDDGSAPFGAIGGALAIAGGVLMARRSLRRSREREAASAPDEA